MPAYTARIVDGAGRTRRIARDATSRAALSRQLAGEGTYALSIDEATPVRTTTPRRASTRSAAATARQLASLLEAELPLSQVLELAAEAADEPGTRAALLAALGRVRDGSPLATALSCRPTLFPPIGIGMVAAGERSGTLSGAVARLAEYLEHREDQRRRLLAALSYPAFMLIAGIAACGVLVVLVLPRFAEMLDIAGVTLPRTTAFLLALGDVARQAWVPAMVGALVSTVAIRLALERPAIRRAFHEGLLRAPLIGPLRSSAAAVHAGQALASLLGEGVPVLAALESTAAGASDVAVAARIRIAASQVRSGISLGSALGDALAFPDTFVRMVRVGERSGAVAPLMHRAALLQERELDRWSQRLIRYAEPAMIIGFGGFVGFVAVALLQAVYGLQAGIVS